MGDSWYSAGVSGAKTVYLITPTGVMKKYRQYLGDIGIGKFDE